MYVYERVFRANVSRSLIAVAIVSVAGARYAAAQTPIHEYRFDGDGSDAVGAAHGTVGAEVGFTSSGVPVVLGQAAKFGTGAPYDAADAIEVDNALFTGFGTGDFSIATWVRRTSTSGRGDIIDANGYAGDGPGFQLQITLSGGQIRLRVDDANGFVRPDSTGAILDTQWHHIVITVDRDDSQGFKYYIDGALDSSHDPTSVPGDINPHQNLRFGSINEAGSFAGEIALFQVFESALAQDEVDRLFCIAGDDIDGDGDRDWDDYAKLAACLLGPDGGLGEGCKCFDSDADLDVDLGNAADFANAFSLDGCTIDGVFYMAGQTAAAPNNCLICDPGQSTSAWSFAPVGTVCRAGSGDSCDPDEVCNGTAPDCPVDIVTPSSVQCRPGSGDLCDPPEFCSGVPGRPCPEDSFAAATVVCRPGSGDMCDPDELCPGVSGEPCPDNLIAPRGIVCNQGSGDSCDPDERCTGNPRERCPQDSFAPSTAVCNRGSGDVCDPDEFCPGKPDLPCPDDQVSVAGTLCRAGSGDMCDPDELCTGVADEPCPDDVVLTDAVICNEGSGDLCDPAEHCTGLPGRPCPNDTFEPATTVCNAGSGDVCDPDEHCTGVADQPCPNDVFEPDTRLCRDVQGQCDVAEYCPGVADGGCPDDAKLGTDVVCRESAGPCDEEEVCDGIQSDCPVDAFKSSETVCRAEGVTILDDGTLVIDGDGLCDLPEHCSGTRAECPPDRLKLEGALCRDLMGVCDSAREFCSGTSKHCPLDESVGGRRCRIAQGYCDVPEYCDPADVDYPDCPADVVAPAGTLCRDLSPDGYPNFQVCDLREFCDGQNAACPEDVGKAVDEVCVRPNGTSGTCQDVGQPKLKCSQSAFIPDGGLCDADFECISGNCAEHLDRRFRCIASNLVGMGGTCDGRDFFFEGDPDGRQCMRDSNSGDQLWCCNGGLPAATNQTGTCSECCRDEDTRGGTGKGVVGCEFEAPRLDCCNGRCSDVSADPYNCGECGINCYDELDMCKIAVLGCSGTGGGYNEDGTCVYDTPCNEANPLEVCYDSCLTCGLTGTCDTCESVPTCSDVCCVLQGSTLCAECNSNSDCDPGQYCQSGCGDSSGVAIIFCTLPSYCVEQPGDCVN